jgi:hypothetical protein
MIISSIYWDPHYNDFTDIYGQLFVDIFQIVTPNELLLMKQKRGVWYIKLSEEVTCELVFPLEEDDLE